ncbi:hypothetical protein R1flu_020390 [Riccia fluitans]|uniref:Uncharacterized protein n=1 Tax=Riccia fluitans TaxID=41844 RepID=A0ABD1ZLD1_9MARC
MVGSSAIVAVEGLRAPALLSSANSLCRSSVSSAPSNNGLPVRRSVAVRAQSGGTRRVKVLPVGDKSGTIRDKASGGAAVKLLSRVEQLRLLSKAEKAGLLSLAENAGFSLSSIEKLGLLSKAEKLGALSAATDPNTPGALLTLALALLLAGPLVVYFVPEDSTPLVILQVLVALVSTVGGSAAFAASNFLAELQKSE